MALTQKARERTRASPVTVATLALLAALLALPLALAPRADGFLYWTRFDAITRANLDGTGVDQMFISGAHSTRRDFWDLAVDDAHLYWTSDTDRIGRANLDGTDVSEDFITGTGGGFGVGGVAVDAEHVYWTHYTCGPDPAGVTRCAGAIGRANLDGTGVDPSFIDGTIPTAVAVDAKHVYWTNYGYTPTGIRYTIGRADLDGTGAEQDFVSAASEDHPLGSLAVDAGHIYWTAQLPISESLFLSPGAIARANLDGTNVDESFIPTKAGDLAIDADHIYWTEWDWPENLHADYWIGRAALDGTAAGPLVDRPSVIALGIAVDDLTDTEVAGKAIAAKTQKQRGKTVRVKLAVEAKEPLIAKASGKIKVDRAYKLKPKSAEFVEWIDTATQVQTETLKLKPRKAAAKEITAALKHGRKATAKLKVKLSDQAGNREAEKLRVRLKGD